MLEEIIRLYSEVKGIYGYRRMTLNVNSRLKRNYNHKRIYRLMKSVHMQAVIRRKKKHYVMSEPRITAENVLNRAFTANRPNEKWLTDVTEFKLLKARRKILCKRFSTKSRMALENRADSGLDPLITESHGGQNGMCAGTA